MELIETIKPIIKRTFNLSLTYEELCTLGAIIGDVDSETIIAAVGNHELPVGEFEPVEDFNFALYTKIKSILTS